MNGPTILALETSGHSGSLAALVGDQVVAERWLDPARRSAQTLAPAMRDLLAELAWPPRSVAVVAVAIGPGSFTGLRVGVVTAKTFAYAVGARVIGISTLDVLAAQAQAVVGLERRYLSVALDAQRGELFVAHYERTADDRWHCSEPGRICSRDAWVSQADSRWALSGPVIAEISAPFAEGVEIVAPMHWLLRADTVGRLASSRALLDDYDDLWQLAPHYLRRSAAEEKIDAARASS